MSASAANAVVFALAKGAEPFDYNGAKTFEMQLASGEVTNVHAISGRTAGFCSHKTDQAVHWKEWFPTRAFDNQQVAELPDVHLEKVHQVVGSCHMADGNWCVMLIADVHYTPPAEPAVGAPRSDQAPSQAT